MKRFIYRRHPQPSLKRNLIMAVITAVYWTVCLSAPTIVLHSLGDSLALHM